MQSKLFFKLGVAAFLVSVSCVTLAEGPIDGKVYGKLFLTVQNTETGLADSVTEVVSNASRLGFKGESNLTNGMSVLYQAEYEIFVDDGASTNNVITSSSFRQRNSFLGLSGDFGTVIGGKHDTPLKLAQNKIDLFNDLSGDIKNVIQGENRLNNIIMYSSPVFSGVTVSGAAVLAENPDQDNGMSLSGVYRTDKLYVALAIDNKVGATQAPGAIYDTIRVVGQYTLNDFIFGALLQTSEPTNAVGDQSETGAFASVAYKLNSKVTFKGQVGSSDQRVLGGQQVSLGADYSLGSKTRIFGFLTQRGADADVAENNYLGFGVEHNF